MIKQFVSPNLRYKDGKIYYLNKKELNDKDHNYIEENYFYYISEINCDDDYSLELVVNDYSDEVLVKFSIEDIIDDNNVKKLMRIINSKICNLENHGSLYNMDV